jgi:O-antigen/teichoic acid export membrane protein
MSLRRNVAANFLGQAWAALMGLAFLPVYIRYLGMEAYGLVGVFAIFQASLALLDLGMSTVLTRETARMRVGASDVQSVRDLLRGTEILLAALGVVAVGVTAAGAHGLATHWFTAGRLPVDVVATALVLMAAVACIRTLEGVYRGGAMGADRQVQVNLVWAAIATVRGVGAIAVLAWVSPTITAFFLWQLVTSLASVGLLGFLLYASFTERRQRPFTFGAWSTAAGAFAGGMFGISILVLVVTQVDKVLLTRLLSLEAYGHYALAATVAGALLLVVTPISQACYPRFSESVGAGRTDALARDYHAAAQVVSIFMGSLAWILVVDADLVLRLWIGDPAIVATTVPLLRLLALGTLLNGSMWIPYQMQLAHAHTRLALWANVAAVLFIVPALLWAVPRYGAVGGATAWTVVNAGYLLFAAPFMYRRIVPGEGRRWLMEDLVLPLSAGGAAAFALRGLWPADGSALSDLLCVGTSAAVAAVASLAAASMWRGRAVQTLTRRLQRASAA